MAEGTMGHELHDLELVAAFAVSDVDPGARERAMVLVSSCDECAALVVDIAAIASGMRADARLTAVAPRDFRLAPADARRLRGGSLPARVARALGFAGSGALRPIGTALATLGLAAFVLSGGLPGGPFGIGGAATGDSRQVLATAEAKDLATRGAPVATQGPAFAQASAAPTTAPEGAIAPVPGAPGAAPVPGGSSTTLALLSAGVTILGLVLVLASFGRRPRGG